MFLRKILILFIGGNILHEGHRQRMYEKLKNGDDLFDHEILEILLYSVCPRVNTNPIAHALLDRFVTISGVFGASIEELKEVDGVGDTVARFLSTVGQCAERAGNIGNAPTLKTLADCKKFVELRLSGKTVEYLELYLLNKAGKVERILNYTTAERSRAGANMDNMARSIALFRPHSIVMAHNHINGTINPSDYDDKITLMLQFICNMNGVQLLDHLIYLGHGQIFSYKDNGLLEKTKNFCSWEKFEKWIKTLN